MRTAYFLLISLLILFTACKSSKEIKSGTNAYLSKNYSIAVELLPKEVNGLKTTDEQETKMRWIAESYKNLENYANAGNWLAKAYEIRKKDSIGIELGKMLMMQEEYGMAKGVFDEVAGQNTLAGDEAEYLSRLCNQATQWKANPQNLKLKPFNEINTVSSEYALITMPNKTFSFTSSRTNAQGDETYGWTGEQFGDIFLYHQGDSVIEMNGINTNFYEGTHTFNKNYTQIIFSRCGSSSETNDYCQLYESKFDGLIWQEPQKINLFGDSVNHAQPFLSSDGKKLYFASDAKDGFGKKDLYVSEWKDGQWQFPSNLGRRINTEGNEMFPYIDNEGNLFFSSDFLPGMGGLDIFEAKWVKGEYQTPENLQYPMNSGADDFAITFIKTKPNNSQDEVIKSGYLSSDRKGGSGKDDIYYFEYYFNNIFTLYLNTFELSEDSAALGKVKVRLWGNDLDTSFITDNQGFYKITLSKESNYQLEANKNGYFATNGKVSTKGLKNADKNEIIINQSLYLEKVESDKEIVIDNIYYDYDKANLREESFPALDTLVVLFKQNADLIIEIGSHTDSRGSDKYNQDLSQRRAQSVVDYLVEKGINADRLVAKGYGETKLVNRCANGVDCTEDEHQQNRRTTFRIISSTINISSEE